MPFFQANISFLGAGFRLSIGIATIDSRIFVILGNVRKGYMLPINVDYFISYSAATMSTCQVRGTSFTTSPVGE